MRLHHRAGVFNGNILNAGVVAVGQKRLDGLVSGAEDGGLGRSILQGIVIVGMAQQLQPQTVVAVAFEHIDDRHLRLQVCRRHEHLAFIRVFAGSQSGKNHR